MTRYSLLYIALHDTEQELMSLNYSLTNWAQYLSVEETGTRNIHIGDEDLLTQGEDNYIKLRQIVIWNASLTESQHTGPQITIRYQTSQIQVYVTKNLGHNYFKIEKCEDLSSDHTPVLLNIFKQAVALEPPQNIHSKNTNWRLNREIISSELNLIIKLKTDEDVETAVEMFNSTIHLAATSSTPKNRESKDKADGIPKEHNGEDQRTAQSEKRMAQNQIPFGQN